jgi:5'-3' exonuclease
LIEEMIKKMNIKLVEVAGCEADDVIWTLATNLWKNSEYEIDILTWDKDLYSLVSKNVMIFDTMKKKKFCHSEKSIYYLSVFRAKFWKSKKHTINKAISVNEVYFFHC